MVLLLIFFHPIAKRLCATRVEPAEFLNRFVQVIKPPGEHFQGVEEVDPPSTFCNALADDLAFRAPSFPNNMPSDPTPSLESTNLV